MLTGFGRDLALAARRLWQTPIFTVFAVLSLAVGVGLTTAVYSIVDTIFWTESGVAEPDRTAVIKSPDGVASDVRWIVSRPDYDDFRKSQRSFERLAASQVIYPAVATADTTEVLQAEAVDAEYFRVVGVNAALGRNLLPDDDAARASVVVLGHELWRLRFGADPAIAGKSVRIFGRPFEIVGVLPRDYGGITPGPARATQLWIPLGSVNESLPLPSRGRDGRGPRRLTMVGRLAAGVSIEAAQTEVAGLAAAFDRSHPLPPDATSGRATARHWRPETIRQLRARADQGLGRFGLLLIVLIALVLLVACTNLSNLVLARGTMRHQEFAVRRALGAPRWRLVREQCAESVILALLGGIGAYLLLRVLVTTMDAELPMAGNWIVSIQPEINATVLAVSAVAMLLSLLVFGLEPALQLTRKTDVRDDLASSAGNVVGVPKAKRQRTLLRWQVAISAGFFVVASMTVRYLAAEARHDSGIELDRIAVGHIDCYMQRWDEARVRRTIARILDEARREPGVEAAAASSGLPFGTTFEPGARFARPDDPKLAKGERDGGSLIISTPDYFRTTGTRIVYGRGFDDRDDATAPQVVVLSESTARSTFGTANAVGRQLLVRISPRTIPATDGPDVLTTVVGIAADTDTTHFFGRRSGDTVYRPLAQVYSPWMTLVVRAGDPDHAAAAIRRAVRRADPDLALSGKHVGGGRRVLTGPYMFLRTAALTALGLGLVTLLLAMAGLYGVQSHIVAHRTREIGVRMSFGATASQIRSMVLKDGYRPVIQGLLIGLFIGFGGRALVRALFDGRVAVFDVWMFTLVPIPLLLAAFFACYLPARRASRVDPNIALRHL